MRSLKDWRMKEETKLRILRSEKGRVGNELPDNKVVAGGDLKTGPSHFTNQLAGFKSKIVNADGGKGLGNEGMSSVSKSTFPDKSGQIPTISNGVPVGEPRGQFKEFDMTGMSLGGQPNTQSPLDRSPANTDPIGPDDQGPAGVEPPAGIPPQMLRWVAKGMEGVENLTPQKIRALWSWVNATMQQKMQSSSASNSLGRTMQNQQATSLRSGGAGLN